MSLKNRLPLGSRISKFKTGLRDSHTQFDSLAKPSGSILHKLDAKKAARVGLLSSFSETKTFFGNLKKGSTVTKVNPLVCVRSLVNSIGEERAAILFKGVKGKTQLSGLFKALAHPDKTKNHPAHDAKMGKLIGGMIKGMGVGAAEEFILNAENIGTAHLIKTIGVTNLVKLVRNIGAKETALIIGNNRARPLGELVNGAGLGKTIRLIKHCGSVNAIGENLSFFSNPYNVGDKGKYRSNDFVQTVNLAGPEKVGDLIKFLDGNPGPKNKVANLINYLGYKSASELISKTNPKDLALIVKSDSPFGVAIGVRKIGVDAFLKEVY